MIVIYLINEYAFINIYIYKKSFNYLDSYIIINFTLFYILFIEF